jgi:hypothetical protein
MNWVMFNRGELCLKKNVRYFMNTKFVGETVLKEVTQNGHTFQFKDHAGKGYSLTHNGMIWWIQDRSELADVYEYLSFNKPFPTWETFVGFLKEL